MSRLNLKVNRQNEIRIGISAINFKSCFFFWWSYSSVITRGHEAIHAALARPAGRDRVQATGPTFTGILNSSEMSRKGKSEQERANSFDFRSSFLGLVRREEEIITYPWRELLLPLLSWRCYDTKSENISLQNWCWSRGSRTSFWCSNSNPYPLQAIL